MAIIYGLFDPRTGALRYVGKAADPEVRLREHLLRARKGGRVHLDCWLRLLLHEETAPQMQVLERVPEDVAWQDRERFWISYYRERGADLLNLTDGGDGLSGCPLATREKMAAAKRGRVASEATRAKMRESHRHRDNTQIRAAAVSRRGVPLTEETKAKLSAGKRGRTPHENTRRAVSEANKRRVISEETRRRLSTGKLGHLTSAETREKLRTAKLGTRGTFTGKAHSEEARRKISEGMKQAHQRRGEGVQNGKA